MVSVEERRVPTALAPDFRAIFERESSYVWNCLRRLGVRASDLEDLAHEVFMTVHLKLAEYDPARPLRPWLFGISFRVASDHRRRAYHHRERGDVDIEPVDPAVPADEQLAAEQSRRLLMAALDALDLDRRAVVVLHEIDGIAMPEVATTLGIPLNTAYSRLRLAREQLQAAVRRLRASNGAP